MNLTLRRASYSADGIFGHLFDESETVIACTLEHAFQNGTNYFPIIPAGVYTCQRGQHQLEGMNAPFTTFQIMDIPGHTNVLLHVGNFNKDSSGCVLIGTRIEGEMLMESKIAFDAFMELEAGLDTFQLTVVA